MKRNLNPIISAIAVSCLLSFTGCTKDFDKINTNPVTNSSEKFNPNFVLSSAQLNYTGSFDMAYDAFRSNFSLAGPIVQALANCTQEWRGDKYLIFEEHTAAYWGTGAVGSYIEQVRNIVDVVENTRGKEQYKNLHQIARIWRVVVLSRITDLYGDVPASEAGLGYYQKLYLPKYDKQQDIYNTMLSELDEAVNALQASGDIVTGDIIYKGDIEKWKRFTNSFMLRLAMRLVKVDEAKAKTYAQKAIANTFTSNADNAFVKHDVNGARITQNRNSQVLLGDVGSQDYYYGKWSNTFIDYLKKTNDPRLGKIAVTKLHISLSNKDQNPNFVTDPLVQKGMPNGKQVDAANGDAFDIRKDPSFTDYPDYSSPNPNMSKRDGITFILTYAQAELLRAEAAKRWAIGGTAGEHYNKGVGAAISCLSQYDSKLTISDAEINDYLTKMPYNDANGLKMINEQYWAHTNTLFDFYESWNNWKRSGFPVLVPVKHPDNSTGGVIPRRYPYPITEASNNPDHYKAASAAVTGGDSYIGRVWWDK